MNRRFALALTCVALALPCSLVQAQGADRGQSPACLQSLSRLQAREDAAASSDDPRAQGPELLALRREAARACLGSAADLPSAAQRLAQPPLAVAPVRPAAPVAPVHALQLPAPPPRSEPLRQITACDPGGCLTTDGTRLQRAGPNLIGPHGLCTLQGALLVCP